LKDIGDDAFRGGVVCLRISSKKKAPPSTQVELANKLSLPCEGTIRYSQSTGLTSETIPIYLDKSNISHYFLRYYRCGAASWISQEFPLSIRC